jgi:hypothetical protein
VLTLNTGMQCDVTVQTPDGRLQYNGDARIDGVPGTAAPISIDFLDTAGSVCPGLLPSGRVLDRAIVDDGVEAFDLDATLIDNGMPMVLVRAADLGVSGYEGVAELNANEALKTKLEALRLTAGPLMGLGDVARPRATRRCAWSRRRATAAASPPAASSRTSAMRRSACWPPSPSLPPACWKAPSPQGIASVPGRPVEKPSRSNTRPANSASSWDSMPATRKKSCAPPCCAPPAPSCAAKS